LSMMSADAPCCPQQNPVFIVHILALDRQPPRGARVDLAPQRSDGRAGDVHPDVVPSFSDGSHRIAMTRSARCSLPCHRFVNDHEVVHVVTLITRGLPPPRVAISGTARCCWSAVSFVSRKTCRGPSPPRSAGRSADCHRP
jgi:hypothetical protein